MQSTCDVVGSLKSGPVVHIAFVGYYPAGSLGNDTARAMRECTAQAVAEHAPAAVIFDLLGVEYRWGDAVMQIAVPLLQADRSFLPARILTKGKTGAALAPLLVPNSLLGIAGVTHSTSLRAALEELAGGDGLGPTP